MQVEVRLFAMLARFLPPGSRDGAGVVELEPGATVHHLIERLAIPTDMSRIVLVNGRDVEDDERLEPGDVVDVFPPLAGGSPDSHGGRLTRPGSGSRCYGSV